MYHSTKIFSDTCILMFFQRFTAQPEGEVSSSRALFILCSKPTRAKKNIESLGKNPQNYENNRNETDVYKQKPLKIGDFNEAEKKEIKEHVEKRKIKRREVAEKNKL